MATKKSAQIKMKNSTGGKALITLYHYNDYYRVWESKSFTLDNGSTSGSTLTVYFPTGIDVATAMDYWAIRVSVMGGSAKGIYGSTNTYPLSSAPWGTKECQMQSSDAGKTLTFNVSTTTFKINLNSGSCSDSMVKLRDYSPITNVFVLMLENRSFDNIFGKSGISGITVPPKNASNSYNGQTFLFGSGSPFRMTTDPGHEFEDVVEQLAGEGKSYNGGNYPPINNSGFAANYATSTTEGSKPEPGNIGDIMLGYSTATKLPVLYSLATNFAICDHWFSSLPGPTWPNRFFLHGASSVGMDDSPSSSQMKKWESVDGFEYPNGSIFDLLTSKGLNYRLYCDKNNSFSDDPQDGSMFGWIPQVGALSGIMPTDAYDVVGLANDLKSPYYFDYTFIEPNYGDIYDNTYKGGSSQHPMDDTYGGEGIVKSVYEAIRNSPIWKSSLLIITYDEHGGFYDSVAPGTTVNPGDVKLPSSYTRHGFNFTQLGVRVPAIIVSPLIKKGTVSQTIYDHSSVAKTLETIFSDSMRTLGPLTNRDAGANNLTPLLTIKIANGDTLNEGPATLPNPYKPSTSGVTSKAVKRPASLAKTPLPKSGNLIGFLGIALKIEIKLTGANKTQRKQLVKKVRAIKTMAEARKYVRSVHTLAKRHFQKRAKAEAKNPMLG